MATKQEAPPQEVTPEQQLAAMRQRMALDAMRRAVGEIQDRGNEQSAQQGAESLASIRGYTDQPELPREPVPEAPIADEPIAPVDAAPAIRAPANERPAREQRTIAPPPPESRNEYDYPTGGDTIPAPPELGEGNVFMKGGRYSYQPTTPGGNRTHNVEQIQQNLRPGETIDDYEARVLADEPERGRTSYSTSDLSPEMQSGVSAFVADLQSQGYNYRNADTKRSQSAQEIAFRRGRGDNAGPVRTWTLTSKHGAGEAADFVPIDAEGNEMPAGTEFEASIRAFQETAQKHGFRTLDPRDDPFHIEEVSEPDTRTSISFADPSYDPSTGEPGLPDLSGVNERMAYLQARGAAEDDPEVRSATEVWAERLEALDSGRVERSAVRAEREAIESDERGALSGTSEAANEALLAENIRMGRTPPLANLETPMQRAIAASMVIAGGNRTNVPFEELAAEHEELVAGAEHRNTALGGITRFKDRLELLGGYEALGLSKLGEDDPMEEMRIKSRIAQIRGRQQMAYGMREGVTDGLGSDLITGAMDVAAIAMTGGGSLLLQAPRVAAGTGLARAIGTRALVTGAQSAAIEAPIAYLETGDVAQSARRTAGAAAFGALLGGASGGYARRSANRKAAIASQDLLELVNRPLEGTSPSDVVPITGRGGVVDLADLAPDAGVGTRAARIETTSAIEDMTQVEVMARRSEAIRDAGGQLTLFANPFLDPRMLARIGVDEAGAIVGGVTGAATGVEQAQRTDSNEMRGALMGAAIGATAGALGVKGSRQAVRLTSGNYKRLVARWFAPRGDMPEWAFNRRIARDGRINRNAQELQFGLIDFRRAMKQSYEGGRPTEAQLAQANLVLGGRAPSSTLPQPMIPVIQFMRRHTDRLSAGLIEHGVVEGDLAVKITENLGMYLNRSYRVFDDPEWAKNVSEDVLNDARRWIREEFEDLTENEVEGKIAEYLYQDRRFGVIGALSRMETKDISVLARKKDIPAPLRALWGEYTDPRLNYARSVSKTSALLENHRYLQDLSEEGRGRIFFDRATTQNGVEYKHKLGLDAADPKTGRARKLPTATKLSPLDGQYTTPFIAEALNDLGQMAETTPVWLRTLKGLNSGAKYSKTVLSDIAQARNFWGNSGFAAAAGHWRFWKMGRAMQLAAAQRGLGSREGVRVRGRQIVAPEGELRSHLLRLQEAGVLHEDIRANELADVVSDVFKRTFNDRYDFRDAVAATLLQKGQAAAAAGGRVAQSAYRLGDEVWKLFAFDNDITRYGRAFPDMPEEELFNFVAQKVRRSYPTYSLVPRAVKASRNNPVISPFVSFWSEVLRVGKNSIEMVAEDLSDPRTARIGAERLAGLAVAAGGFKAALNYQRERSGVSRRAEDDMRIFMAPWEQNSDILHLGRDEEGQRQFADMSSIDPYSQYRRAINAFMLGEDWEGALVGAMVESVKPVIGEELAAAALIDISRNKKGVDGGPIWLPGDDDATRFTKVATYFWEGALEPGVVAGARRMASGLAGTVDDYGNTVDPRLEALARVSGIRTKTMDIPSAMGFLINDFKAGKAGATGQLTRAMGNRGEVTDRDLVDAVASMQRNREEAYGKMYTAISAAERLGDMTREQIVDLLRASRISQSDVDYLMEGTMPPLELSDRAVSDMLTRLTLTVRPDGIEEMDMEDESNRREDLVRMLIDMTNQERSLEKGEFIIPRRR